MEKWYSSPTGAIFFLAISTRGKTTPKGHLLTQKIIINPMMTAIIGSRQNHFSIKHTAPMAIANLSLCQGNSKT
jgi:hypothetical protein